MSTITFDTLKYAERLKSAGVPDAQARAEAEALRDALAETINHSVVTQSDLVTELGPIKTEVAVLKWMIGFNLAFTMAVLWKTFS